MILLIESIPSIFTIVPIGHNNYNILYSLVIDTYGKDICETPDYLPYTGLCNIIASTKDIF